MHVFAASSMICQIGNLVVIDGWRIESINCMLKVLHTAGLIVA